jgi:hypothetical protein
MKGERVYTVIIAMILMGAALLAIPVSFVSADPVYKQVLGIVDPNSVTAVAAYDPAPADNGWTYFYIQNRTNEGTGTDPITQIGGFDVYDPEIYVNVSDWKVGDECINVVNRDYGTYGVDHAGYVAFMNTTLTPLVGTDIAPNTELLKIPTPSIVANGSDFIEIDWSAISDPNGLVAGYTVYRSTTNGTVSGDADWTLLGGTVNNPLTGLTYNDTSVSGGIGYYYSLKIVFIGYQNNNPGSVDNYECAYFGEGSAMLEAPAPPAEIDFITIVDNAGTGVTEILDQTIWVGFTITGYAAGFNTSSGYVMDVSCTWSVGNAGGATATTTPGPATSSDFDADVNGGTATLTADYGGGITDTVIFTIDPPTVDQIMIVDTPGTGATEVLDQPIWAGFTMTLHAAGYNSTTASYVMDVSCTWSNVNGGGATATTTPGPATSSNFDADVNGGTATVTADYGGGITDTVVFTIDPPTIDMVIIVDTPGTGTNEIIDPTIWVGYTQTLYAAGYNSTSMSYQGDVSCNWGIVNVGGASATTTPGPGTSSDFDADINGGTSTITADYGGGITDTVVFTIDPPTVDTITIVDTAATGATEVLDQNIWVGFTMTLYAAGFNATSGYIGDQSVTWSVGNAGGATATTTPGPGTSSDFDADINGGTATVTADFGGGITDTVIFTIDPPTVDYITIVTNPGTGLSEMLDQDIILNQNKDCYAAGFNTTSGYIGDQTVTWSWLNAGGASASAIPGPDTTTTFSSGPTEGTCTLTADDGSGHLDTVIFTIIDYTVDYIMIVDTMGTGANEILDQNIWVGFAITGYAAGFNNTGGYIGDFVVNWILVNAGGATATATPGPADSSDFDADINGGTATWTADYGGGITELLSSPSIHQPWIQL